MLKQHGAEFAQRAAQLSREAMEAYCWAHPPITPLIIAAGLGLAVGALVAALGTYLAMRRRPVVT